jgi:ABC-type phosphate/phosphonate transport system substrate-binding protein
VSDSALPGPRRQPRQSPLRWLLPCLLLALGCLPLPAQAPPVFTLHVGLSRASFPDLNPRDVELSFKALVEILARQRGYPSRAEVRFFDRSQDFEAAMKRGEIQLAAVGSWEYSDMDLAPAMEPAFVHVEQDRVALDYLLLTRRDSGLNSLRDLKGKEAVVLESTVCLLSMSWLDVLLGEEKLGERESFFRKLEVVRKPSAAVLPVFFGNRQACVVDRMAFQVMTELNPQVGSALQAVATSPPFVSSILCLGTKDWPSDSYRDTLLATLRELHHTPEGRQLLMLFKISRLEPFRDSQLASLRELRSKHKRLGRKS